LVVDDNVDTLQLVQRYLSNSRYRFIGTSDPREVPALVEQLEMDIIVLDVMLPTIDGWELLGRLREHPKTRHTPIIVCTILSQEQLALTLGAAEFIRKPVSRETLLSALDRQTDQLLRKSH
jgi:CheY-like chemotaxis protein